MAKGAVKIPETSTHAKDKGYTKAAKPGAKEKEGLVMIKTGDEWSLRKAASARASKPHIVCYYDPNTGTWTDCHKIG